MAGAQVVDPHFFHDFKLPLHRPRIEGSSQRTMIVVQIHAENLHTSSVEMKSVVGSELKGPHAETGSGSVHDFSATRDGSARDVQPRVSHVPTLGVVEDQGMAEFP